MLCDKYWRVEEVYDRPAAPLDEDTADMTDNTHTLPHKYNANELYLLWFTKTGVTSVNQCYGIHMWDTFYFSPLLKQTLKLAKKSGILTSPSNPHNEKKILTFIQRAFFFI